VENLIGGMKIFIFIDDLQVLSADSILYHINIVSYNIVLLLYRIDNWVIITNIFFYFRKKNKEKI